MEQMQHDLQHTQPPYWCKTCIFSYGTAIDVTVAMSDELDRRLFDAPDIVDRKLRLTAKALGGY